MAEATYRILIRKNERTCDVEITGPGAKPSVMRTFDTEASAWEWITEQEYVGKFAVAEAKARRDKRSASLGPDELLKLGEAAVAELERRGYDVRGKSADQITKILRFPPPKPKASP
jgi:hypothetical protein